MYRPLGAFRSGWMDNIEMYIRETGCENTVWSRDSVWGQSAGCLEHGNETSGFINYGLLLTTWANIKLASLEGLCAMELQTTTYIHLHPNKILLLVCSFHFELSVSDVRKSYVQHSVRRLQVFQFCLWITVTDINQVSCCSNLFNGYFILICIDIWLIKVHVKPPKCCTEEFR